MHTREGLQRVFIISELHPQHSGSIDNLKTMVLQSKVAGADAVKVQLYDAKKMFGDSSREYLQINREELVEIKQYADQVGIEVFASVFDLERLAWCEEMDFRKYKIASRSVEDKNLCEAIIATKKPVLISLGNFPWEKKGFPYEGEKLIYMYCVSNYPTLLEEVRIPEFQTRGFMGYSDHTIGIAGCLFAAAHGAKYVEKHFSLSKSKQFNTEKAHLGSMDFEELRILRTLIDDISLLKWNKAEL